MILSDTFPNRVDTVLKLDHITRSKFYTDLNITRQSFDNWKKGTVPTALNLNKIADYLNVNSTWLLLEQIKRSDFEKKIFENQCKIINKFIQQNPTSEITQLFPKNQLTKCLKGMQTFSLEQLFQLSIIMNKSILSLVSPEDTEPLVYDKTAVMFKYLKKENKQTVFNIIEALYIKETTENKGDK